MLAFFCALLNFHIPICLPMLYNTITTTKWFCWMIFVRAFVFKQQTTAITSSCFGKLLNWFLEKFCKCNNRSSFHVAFHKIVGEERKCCPTCTCEQCINKLQTQIFIALINCRNGNLHLKNLSTMGEGGTWIMPTK